ncbi:hypothetical protein KCU95_g966, partial [Aureobasidium melanogenum]
MAALVTTNLRSISVGQRPSLLLSVPTEIVEMVAAFADDAFPEKRPLSKLRLTCRQLRDQINPKFAQRYLSEPFIMMSRYGLEALDDIWRNPVFGPRVRKVRLRAYADMDGVVETLAKKNGYGLLEPDKMFTVHQKPEQRVKEAAEILVGENLPLRTSEKATILFRTAFKLLLEMSDTTRAPPNLLSMPNEILAKICAFAVDDHREIGYLNGKAWLTAARLTCKQLYTPATLEFGKMFLQDPLVMMTEYSLRALNDICAHPLFGPRVHAVRVDAHRLGDLDLREIYKEIKNAVLARNIEQMNVAENRLQERLDMYEEEYGLEDSGRAEDLLVKALRSIKRHNKPINIALMATTDEMPIGFLRRCGSGYAYQIKKTFRMLVSAVKSSQCRINKFFCCIPPDSDEPVNDNNPEIDMAEIATSSGIFADLACIEFDIHCYIPTFTAGLSGVLESADKISDLKLGTSFWCIDPRVYGAKESHDTTKALLSSVCSSRLHRVCFRALVLKPAFLKSFLMKHRHTLQKVVFDNVTMVGPWDEVLVYIRGNLNLQMLQLFESHHMAVSEFEDDDIEDKAAQYRSYDVVWRGPENVRVGLDKLLEEERKDVEEHGQEELSD